MQDHAEQPKRGMAWGIAGSVVLHLLFAALFFIPLPLPSFEAPEEEAVSVEMVPEPEPEKGPEAEKEPEPEKPAEAETPPPPPAPAATMLAVPPPVSDAPEREDALGETAPKDNPAPVETAPKAEQGERQDAAPAEGEPLPDAAAPAETPPQATETAEDTAERPAEEGEAEAPPVPDILAAASEAASDSGEAAAPEHPPVPQPRPQPPASGAKGSASGVAETLRPAERVLSNVRFADPVMREALGQLPLPKRIVQLCTVEALSQIMAVRPGTPLHGMVPFGDHDGRIENGTLSASGGAYRTMAGDWYDISFRCSVDIPQMRITDFSYRLGDHKLTREERAERGLPAG